MTQPAGDIPAATTDGAVNSEASGECAAGSEQQDED
jgi:hypothetical protein